MMVLKSCKEKPPFLGVHFAPWGVHFEPWGVHFAPSRRHLESWGVHFCSAYLGLSA